MKKGEIKIEMNVSHKEHGEVMVVKQARGWVTVEDSDGELHKVRPATLELRTDESEVEIESPVNVVEGEDAPTIDEESAPITDEDIDAGNHVDEDTEELDEDEDEDEESSEDGTSMKSQLEKFRVNYVDSVSASGNKSQHNGDGLAVALAGLTGIQVCDIAESVLELDFDLGAKYAHLNEGQKRMNAGNRLRAAIKNEDSDVNIETVTAVASAYHAANTDAAIERNRQVAENKAAAEAKDAEPEVEEIDEAVIGPA